MGWITNKRNRTGKGIGGGNSKRKSAPLKSIICVIQHGDNSLFGRGDLVELECGHQVFTKSDNKARCLKCKIIKQTKGGE